MHLILPESPPNFDLDPTKTGNKEYLQSFSDNNGKPIYRTSIYINSEGEADIKTTSNVSPVLSPLRLNHVSEEDIEVTLRNVDDKMYFSSVSFQRHSDRGLERSIETPSKHLSCVSTNIH